jgi:hypothetical protein
MQRPIDEKPPIAIALTILRFAYLPRAIWLRQIMKPRKRKARNRLSFRLPTV